MLPNKVGETKTAKEAGKSGWSRCIWLRCPDCGSERWVRTQATKHPNFQKGLCRSCIAKKQVREGKSNFHWKGGFYYSKGYKFVFIASDNPFQTICIKNTNYILEHRLIMAEHIKRCLLPYERVHHVNGKKDDNRIENLKLFSYKKHKTDYGAAYREGYSEGYNACLREHKWKIDN